jgi:predicted transcriptional regulator
MAQECSRCTKRTVGHFKRKEKWHENRSYYTISKQNGNREQLLHKIKAKWGDIIM